MSEKKTVSRRIVITFGIICIILVVGLVGAFAIFGQTNPQFIDISQYTTVTITYYW
jgi:hypothetical protein